MGRGGTVAVQHSPLGGQMEISVLGPVEVSAGGLPVAIDAGKPRALLALLALHEGSTVSTDRLVQGAVG
jgi:DNA-binding SARP family transcriptional activator